MNRAARRLSLRQPGEELPFRRGQVVDQLETGFFYCLLPEPGIGSQDLGRRVARRLRVQVREDFSPIMASMIASYFSVWFGCCSVREKRYISKSQTGR